MIENIMEKMIKYFGNDVKRINHAIKVYTFAMNIAKLENVEENKMKIIQIAAILHDIGIKESERKYNSSSGKYQEMEGPAIAKEILKNFNLEENLIERVCFLIGNHHTYTKINDVDFQILVEADFIVNIFEDDIQKQQVKSISDKYFKTKTGTNYLESMYISLECDCNNE